MPGVRLAHPKAQGGLYLVEDLSRPYPRPLYCATCSSALRAEIAHHVKTYHLTLDGGGTVIVSTGIYERLKKIPGLGGLQLVNSVADPPPQRLDLDGELKAPPIVTSQRDFRPFQGGR